MPRRDPWRDGRPSGWLIGRSCLGVAAQPRSAGTAGCLLLQAANRYVAARWALRTTGVRRSGRINLLIGNNKLPTWAGASRALARLALSHLVTYPHQITFPSAGPVPPRGYCLHRMVWLALRASVTSWSVGVQLALVADGACRPVLGMLACSAVRTRLSGSTVLCMGLWASPRGPLRIGWGPYS